MTAPDAARAAEAERQRRLIAALLAAESDAGALNTREAGVPARRALQAYRANADASAERSLAAAFPTVQRLVGAADFRHLSHGFWRADPPVRGDLGEWGGRFPDWLETHPRLSEWPYLGDCARLDWAMHCCERAEDARLDAASIARLGDTEPSRLVLRAAPGLALVESRWPIACIHEAHQSEEASAFDAAREAIAAQQGETALVARRDWKAVPTRVGAGTAAWTRLLLAGLALDALLARAPHDVDFTTWFTAALQGGWVKGITVLSD